MKYTTEELGKIIRETRKNLGVTQKGLALTSGTGLRFVIDLEKGKETCEIGKALTVLQTLGIKLTLTPPSPRRKKNNPWPEHWMSTLIAISSATLYRTTADRCRSRMRKAGW